jgi:hypothetical protein
VVSPELTYDIIIHKKNMICSGKKVKHHYHEGGCTDSNPGPFDMWTNAFPTKPAVSPDAQSSDDSIRPYWDIYTRQIRLASIGWPRARVVEGSRYYRYDIDYDIIGYDIDCDIMTMIS